LSQPPGDPEGAVSVVEADALRAALEHKELLAEEEVLGREAGTVGGEGADELQQTEKEPHAGG